MALLARLTAPGSPKALNRLQNCISFLIPSLQSNRKSSIRMDVIEDFTNNLVERKTKKWEELRENLMKKEKATVETTTQNEVTNNISKNVGLLTKGAMNDVEDLKTQQIGLDIRSLSQAQLDNLLLSTLEIKNSVDFLYLIRQCIRFNKLPSYDALVSCLKYLCTLSRLQQIESFAEICTAQNHPIMKTYADLAPFKAMALWRSGRTDAALLTLHRGYGASSSSTEGKRMIRTAFRTICEETLTHKSEAVLVSLMEVARSIYQEHNDIFVIACVWKQCFISDWFSDQKTASDLLETYKELQQLLEKRADSLCNSFLSRHNVDAVHRLIEVFLQYKQSQAYTIVLRILFNYQHYQKDEKACAEIIRSCIELAVPLTDFQKDMFLKVFFGHLDMPPNKKSSNELKPYQYKF